MNSTAHDNSFVLVHRLTSEHPEDLYGHAKIIRLPALSTFVAYLKARERKYTSIVGHNTDLDFRLRTEL